MTSIIVETSDLTKTLGPPIRGKVRDLYSINDDVLLFIATDRVSAFDVVLKSGIPNKGALLNKLSAHWFNLLSNAIPNLQHHFLSLALPTQIPENLRDQYKWRSMQVRKLQVFPVEAIVRGFITGSAWKEYQAKGTVHGMKIRDGLLQGEAFPGGAIYTPSTKAEAGKHDENIHPDKVVELIGEKYAIRIEELSISLYKHAQEYALSRGIIIADTKFEFGLDTNTDEVVLIDEVLTPDSSRFWSKSSYRIGKVQSSFDKQYLRDWLISQNLQDKPDVELPDDIITKTEEKYREVFERLVGQTWDDCQAEKV